MGEVWPENRATPRLLALGDAAWTVEFGDSIDPLLHGRVIGLADALGEARATGMPEFAGIVDVVPTFRSLTVHFNPLLTEGTRLGEALLRLAVEAGICETAGRHWQIPVCFDDGFAPDLEELAHAKEMRRDAVIALLTSTVFRVYMIGFMPGFPYMGGLPSVLEMPRLVSPRKAVPARSLAIAGAMCAVYPWESPGGWRLLGRTPVPFFSAADSEFPALLSSGDSVCWQAIDRAEYDRIEAEARNDGFDRKQFLLPGGGQ